MPDGRVVPEGDPAEVAVARETIRLAFVAALQHLPPRQRAVLILCEVLRWKATEVAELLETSVASVNSALQRARATLEPSNVSAADTTPSVDEADAELLARYVDAFERYDMDALTALIHEDATQSMPPFDLWLQRPRRHLRVVVRPGHRLPRLARDPDRGRERRAGVRPVQAEPDRRRLRAVGAPGARDRGRPDRRVHVLPRHRRRSSRCSACRCLDRARRPQRSVRQDVAQAHEGDELEQLARRVAQPTWQPWRRAASWSRASASTVTASDVDAAHVAERDVGAARARAARRRGRRARAGRRGRSGRGSRRRSCWLAHASEHRPGAVPKLIGRATDEFSSATGGLTLRRATRERSDADDHG